MSTLDSFVRSSKPPPEIVSTSQEIRDRGSIFIANTFRATSEAEARRSVAHLRNVVHGQKRASHEMCAWRCMVLKPERTGLAGEDDFEVRQGNEDDGEKWGSMRILKVMQAEGVIDAVVVVSRWYGGEMIGPARFSHIETCTREACRSFRVRDEVEELVVTLRSLDDILVTLRAELQVLRVSQSTFEDTKTIERKAPDYDTLMDSLDVEKAKRLVAAREKAIKSVKLNIQKLTPRSSGSDDIKADHTS